MNGKEIISLLEKSKELPKINRNVLEIISLIDSTEKNNMDVLAEKLKDVADLKYDLLANVNSGYFKLKRTVNSLPEAKLCT